MTGFNEAHGDTEAVLFDLSNEQGMYNDFRRIIDNVPWWDDSDNTWNDIDKSARQLKELVSDLREYADSHPDDYTKGEIRDADLSSVDYEELVIDELRQLNIDAGRNADEGL